jgi:DNA-directed RNA polymerase subunit RPC12/RpoP
MGKCSSCGCESESLQHVYGLGEFCPACKAEFEAEEAKKQYYADKMRKPKEDTI